MEVIKLRKIDFLTAKDFTYNKVPSRMIYLRDTIEGQLSDQTFTAYQRLKAVQAYKPLVFTDIYRSPAGSAEAYRNKPGVAKPGYSGHNYGVSVDVAVEASCQRHSISYQELCSSMIAFGWTPYQGIQKNSPYMRGKEDWHFNFIGDFVGKGSSQINNWINHNFTFESDTKAVQLILTQLKFYHGDIDGHTGPLTTNGIRLFQQAWMNISTGILDETTIRILNIVATKVQDEQGNIII